MSSADLRLKCGLLVPFECRGGGGADGLCGSVAEAQAISVDLHPLWMGPGAVKGERNAAAGAEVRDEVGVDRKRSR